MTALFLTVLVASLVGSTHCAGMCGAFVAFAIGAGDPVVRQSRAFLLSLYQGGRLITYVALGALAGALGAGLDMSGSLLGLQRAAAILSGTMMVLFGAITLLRLSGLRAASSPMSRRLLAPLTALVTSAHRRMLRHSPPVRAVATGLLTTLLPCGWLWAFVITSAGTGSTWVGATLMATFWLGTLPMMTFVGMGVRALAKPLAARWPAITASAIVAVGLYTIVARAHIILPHPATMPHGDATVLTAHIKAIDEKTLPCCTSKPADKGGNP